MSDRTVPDIDPRFDPRFQRGYVPDAAAPPSEHVPSPPAPPAVSAAVEAITDESPARHHVGVGEPPTSAEPSKPSPPRQHASIADAEEEPVGAGVFEDSAAGEASRFEPWFVAAWAVAILATMVGASLWWGAVASETFSGPSNVSDRWLLIVGWSVAPPLIEGGLLGVVGMLVWTGIRHVSRHPEESS